MTFFLKLRHWELFLMLALPGLLCLMFRIPFSPLIIATIGLFLMLVLFAWMFSVGRWSNRQLAPEQQTGTAWFAAGLALPIVYLLAYIILIVPELGSGAPVKPKAWMFALHMLSLSGIFYGIWFTAGRLMALLQREQADNMIFSNAFFLLFVFPIGVWLIQPGVNRLYFKLDNSQGSNEA